MSKKLITVLIYAHHKLLNLIYVYVYLQPNLM
jgi:hypothetical protein